MIGRDGYIYDLRLIGGDRVSDKDIGDRERRGKEQERKREKEKEREKTETQIQRQREQEQYCRSLFNS